MKPATAWRLSSRLLFGQMYEDVELERRAFTPGSRVFCIASAGCTAISLSADYQVTAVDLNPSQVAYARLRAAGAPPRWGFVDRVMRAERHALILAGWTVPHLERFLALDDCAEQLTYWRRYLNTRRFRAAFDSKVALDALALRLLARDRNLPLLHLGGIMRRRLERGFTRYANSANPYVQRLLGVGLPPNGPPAANPIRFEIANAADFLQAMPADSFDAFSLSNIADAASASFRTQLLQAVGHAAAPGAIAVLRSFAEPHNRQEAEYATQDRSMLWGSIQVLPARDLR